MHRIIKCTHNSFTCSNDTIKDIVSWLQIALHRSRRVKPWYGSGGTSELAFYLFTLWVISFIINIHMFMCIYVWWWWMVYDWYWPWKLYVYMWRYTYVCYQFAMELIHVYDLWICYMDKDTSMLSMKWKLFALHLANKRAVNCVY